MRPPLCFVCDREFAASQEQLVHFVTSDPGRAWDQRANANGRMMPGHHPDTGWFCPTHSERASDLAATHTITEALAVLSAESN